MRYVKFTSAIAPSKQALFINIMIITSEHTSKGNMVNYTKADCLMHILISNTSKVYQDTIITY